MLYVTSSTAQTTTHISRGTQVFAYCIGIQKHFVGNEIPKFDLSNRFSGLQELVIFFQR
jgi:hypothetical protein